MLILRSIRIFSDKCWKKIDRSPKQKIKKHIFHLKKFLKMFPWRRKMRTSKPVKPFRRKVQNFRPKLQKKISKFESLNFSGEKILKTFVWTRRMMISQCTQKILAENPWKFCSKSAKKSRNIKPWEAILPQKILLDAKNAVLKTMPKNKWKSYEFLCWNSERNAKVLFRCQKRSKQFRWTHKKHISSIQPKKLWTKLLEHREILCCNGTFQKQNFSKEIFSWIRKIKSSEPAGKKFTEIGKVSIEVQKNYGRTKNSKNNFSKCSSGHVKCRVETFLPQLLKKIARSRKNFTKVWTSWTRKHSSKRSAGHLERWFHNLAKPFCHIEKKKFSSCEKNKSWNIWKKSVIPQNHPVDR